MTDPTKRQESDFRTYPPETMTGPAGRPVTIQLCEELDPESGRWEPFYSMVIR